MRTKNPAYFELLIRFIDDYIDNYGRSPSTQEIASGTGLSPATVSRYLSRMREDGIIDYSGHRNIVTKRNTEPVRPRTSGSQARQHGKNAQLLPFGF